jgi:APA family basic amino acid/polyamine antiporter
VFGLHVAGVRVYGLSVTILLGVILLSVVVIAVIGFTTTPHTFVTDAYVATHVRLSPPVHPRAPNAGAFLAVVGLMIAAYGGVNSATFLGGEARDATRTVPRGLFLGWAVAVVIYAIVIFAVFHAVPYWATLGLIHHNAGSFATAPGLIGVVAPHILGVALGLIVALIVCKTMLPLMLVQSRQAFAWAEDGLFPKVFQATSHRQAPSAALLLGASLGSLFLIQSTFIGWEIGIVIRSLAILLMLLLVAAGALRMKYGRSFRGRTEPWVVGITHGFGVTVAAALGIVVAVVVGQSVFVTPGVALQFQPWFQLVIAAVVGAGLYYWFGPHRGLTAKGQWTEVNTSLPLE